MQSQFNTGELIKLRNYASQFFYKVTEFVSQDTKPLLNIKDYETAKSHFTRVIMRNSYKVDGDRILVCDKSGITALYAIDPANNLKLFKIVHASSKTELFFHGEELVRAQKGVDGKYIEILSRVTGYGWLYTQPLNFLPNVFLTSGGGFRSH